MSDKDIIHNAMRRRVELAEELAEIETFIRVYQKLSGQELEEVDESIDQNLGIPQKDFGDVARSLLMKHGRPLTSRQMLLAMREHGVPIGGSDELKNLTTKLWRARDQIERLDNGSYWIRGLRHN